MAALSNDPDLILYNAKIYTVDDSQPWAQAVAIRKHRFLAVGSDAEVTALAGPRTQMIDLGGKMALPGLCDAHIHFYDWSLSLQEVQLADCRSKAEMMARIAQRAQATPAHAWISGRGWNEGRWGETTFPVAADLDGVTGENQPAIFWRNDMHCAVANSAALRVAGIDAATPDPAGGLIDRDANGRPTGLLRELAMNLVTQQMPTPTDAELEAALLQGMAVLHRMGITAIHDQRMVDQHDGPRMIAAYRRLREAKALRLRVNCNIAAHDLPHLAGLGLRYGFGDDYMRLGHVKLFTDGSLGTRTAWMLAPYEKLAEGEADNCGVNVKPPAQMAREFRQAVELGFPISVHAIGDRANRVVLDIFEELADAGLAPPVPHRIEHVQTIDPVDLPRLAALGITASVQPIHATDDMDTADLLLGSRGAHMYNFRTLLDSGARCAYGSDAPVADVNPFAGMHAGLTRRRPDRMERPPWYGEERISLQDVLFGYTKGAALAGGWESLIGSIGPGKRADLIVLDRDLFGLVDDGLVDDGLVDDSLVRTQVELTIFDGQIVYIADTMAEFSPDFS